MKPPFLSRPVNLFGNNAVVILFLVAFMIPFAMRGARMAVTSIKNDVKDWLPRDFPETAELDWFAKHFLGDAFVVVTWPGCTQDDPRLHTLVSKIREETMSVYPPITLDGPGDMALGQRPAHERARYWADKFGLYYAGDHYQNWAGRDEKWLAGDHDQWFFITPSGEFYRWNGNVNLIAGSARSLWRSVTGDKSTSAMLIDRFADAGVKGGKNPIYDDPRPLMTRLFQDVQTGPELLRRLAGEDGSLRAGVGRDQLSASEAERLARQRLTGILFGPQPPPDFNWTAESLLRVLDEGSRSRLRDDWRLVVQQYINELVTDQYAGRIAGLRSAAREAQAKHWNELFVRLEMEPPEPLTCLLVTLSEPSVRDLGRAVARPMLGSSPGRILQLAMDSGISIDDLRLGGPPIDNVAIDQEGTITLVRLIGLSVFVGTTLAYICLGSHMLTVLVQLVGMISAVTSLSILWWTGSVPDAISMSMPPLVYVLGLSGAVHIVNYYRDAAHGQDLSAAPGIALKHGWFPCTLAALTTSLGLVSLNVSKLVPIQRFGMYSAIGVMATLVLLLGFLPAALQVFAPRSRRDKTQNPDEGRLTRFWMRIGDWVLERHWQVAVSCTLLLIVMGWGLRRIETSVQLLNLFDKDARLIQDYVWLEENLCRLVPMEIVARVDGEAQRPPLDDLAAGLVDESEITPLQLDFLERAELIDRIQRVVVREFGESGQRIVGTGMSAATFLPPLPGPEGGGIRSQRSIFNGVLEERRDDLFEAEFIQNDEEDDRELWRLSLRAVALEDIDYGDFVSQLKTAIEPILSAYRYRNKILRYLEQDSSSNESWVYVLGVDPNAETDADSTGAAKTESGAESDENVATANRQQLDQARIFAQTLSDLLFNRGFRNRPNQKKLIWWHDPEQAPISDPEQREQFAGWMSRFDCVVLAADHPEYDLQFIRDNARHFIDARDHHYGPSRSSALTAAERIKKGDTDATTSVIYTGIVPIVYKAQHALLESLINSIGLAFVMIAGVMMLLLRDWRRPVSLNNSLNLRAGMVSMLPNVFPVVIIFGMMAHLGIKIDIGSMMTASVAMGVAVDDTIHFLNWFRKGLRDGLNRQQSIKLAYRRCATAMTQTTLIGGLGLVVFGLSTFTPTQQFGILMLLLLSAALLGDLIFLPALLAGPLGRYFEVDAARTATSGPGRAQPAVAGPSPTTPTRHSSHVTPRRRSPTTLRQDSGHDTLGD